MKTNEKKEKGSSGTLRVIILLLVAATSIIAGFFVIRGFFVEVAGNYMHKNEKTIDLRGTGIRDVSELMKLEAPEQIDLRGNSVSVEQYASLIGRFPECEVLWDVPMSFGSADCMTESLEPKSFEPSDIALLQYFPNLQFLDLSASGITTEEYDRVKAAIPGCSVIWNKEVVGQSFAVETESIILEGKDTSPEELEETIRELPSLKEITIEDCMFDLDEQLRLDEEYPDIRFSWEVGLLGNRYPNDIRELQFDDISADDLSELNRSGRLFNSVEKIDLNGKKLGLDLITELRKSFSGAAVLCTFDFLGRTISTSEEELDFSGMKISDVSVFDLVVPAMYDLKKVVMCECGVPDETMDGLNHKYDGVRFVWTVHVTRYYTLRTDVTYFCGSDRPYADYVAVSLNDEEIQPLKYCTDLVAMDLGHMHFTNLDFVRDMKQLRFLVISCGMVHDISAVSELENLYYLEMFYNNVKDISPILACKNLRYLNIGTCTGFDRSPVFEMDFLEYLWYPHNYFSDEEIARLRAALPNTVCYLDNENANAVWNGWKEMDAYHELRDLLHMFY